MDKLPVFPSVPNVSILLCTAGRSRYFDDCLNSIYQQSFENWELLICIDGSDSSVVADREFNDPRVRLFFNSKQMGLAYCLNKLLINAKGQYVARMDDDDIMHRDRISEQLKIFQSQDIDVCFSGATLIDERGHETGYIPKYPSTKNLLNVALRNPIIHPSVMFAHEWISKNNYNPIMKKAQDWELWLRTHGATKWYFIPFPLMYYRVSSKPDYNKRISTCKFQLWAVRTNSVAMGRRLRLLIFSLIFLKKIYYHILKVCVEKNFGRLN